MVRIKNADEIRNMIVNSPYENRRIFSIVAHIDHGKTTMTDYLLKRAGLMSDEAAGMTLMTDSDEEEQQRGITIFTSVVLLGYTYKDREYLFQINDTPGHISFTGEVSRALRGSDGALILVDALEGVMTQTETNIKLAVGEEYCKPILFINKVDRLISELRLPPKKVAERIDQIINKVNSIIKKVAPPQFKDKWLVRFNDNSVGFGSAKHGWGVTKNIIEEKKIPPLIFFEKYQQGEEGAQWLRKNLPLDEAILRMVIQHLPDPRTAQQYRIPKIWSGDPESEVGKKILNCDPNGPLLGMITKIFIDPKSKRPTLIGRVFSGTLKAGDTIYLVNQKTTARVKRLGVMEITDILDCPEIPAGNLFAVFGFICPSGETFTEPGSNIPGFEEITYVAEPVVSRSIKPIDPQDLAKLGEVVKKWIMADPTAEFKFNQESGEYVLSGIDPLQIEILTKRINEQVPIKVSPPIIVYREKAEKRGLEYHTKSPNGHNRIKLYVEPLDDATVELIKKKVIDVDQDPKERAAILRERANWDAKMARNIWDIYGTNIFINNTTGVQRLDRIKAYVIATFRDFVNNGTLAREPVMSLKVVMTDATVHVDPAHTTFHEIAGMTSSALNLSFLSASPQLYEPVLRVDIKTPTGTEGEIMKIISKHRGQVFGMDSEDDSTRIRGEIPTSETLGIADEFRSATQGRAFFGYEFAGFKPLPEALQEQVILEIRKRKNMPPELPTPKSWERFIYRT
ncbi:MAG: GTP-binding protein [Candidatus Odinarchaeia archaeon]